MLARTLSRWSYPGGGTTRSDSSSSSHSCSLCGFYYDPSHGGCLRRIVSGQAEGTFTILGSYGEDEACPPSSPWTARMTTTSVKEDERSLYEVTFVGKRSKATGRVGTKVLTCQHYPSQRTLRWEDGNVWRKLYVSGSQFPRASGSKIG